MANLSSIPSNDNPALTGDDNDAAAGVDNDDDSSYHPPPDNDATTDDIAGVYDEAGYEAAADNYNAC